MTWLEAVILAVVQGIAEFLPISSSGHLSLMENFFGLSGMENLLLFDVMLHVGTLIAVVAAFFDDVKDMVLAFFRLLTRRGRAAEPTPAGRLVVLIVLATLPLVLVVFFKDAVESWKSSSILVGAALILTGVLLLLSDRVKKGTKDERTARVSDVLVVGLMQVAATVPGLSRSGTTISGGLMRGFSRQFAVRFAFLMSIPAVVAAAVLEGKDALAQGVDPALWPMMLVGMAVAGVVGYGAIRLVRLLTEKGKFGGFAWYCFVVGAAAIIIDLVMRG